MPKITDLTLLSDMELVVFTRSGVDEAYAELWRRHSGAIMAAARCFTGFDPEDVMQEAFTKILTQLRDGHGPDTAFRPYALSTARSIATNMSCKRANREITGEEAVTFENAGLVVEDDGDRSFENSLTLTAFKSLPTRWQEVLWYRDVEDFTVKACSDTLGIQENATSVLLKRAREGFKQAWIRANLSPGRDLHPECQWVIERLAKYTRGRAPAVAGKRIEAHLPVCRRCAIVAEESKDIHRRLALVLLPAILGTTGAAGYGAWAQSEENVIASASGPSLVSVKRLGTGRVVISALTSTVSVILAIVLALVLTISIAEANGRSQSGDVNPEQDKSNGTSDVAGNGQGLEGDPPAAGGEIVDYLPRELRPAYSIPVLEPGFTFERCRPRPSPVPDAPLEFPSINFPSVEVPAVPPGDYIDQIAVPLSASPADGLEVGVYPRLQGVGTPGGVADIVVTNETFDVVTAEIPISEFGRWRFTPAGIEGTLTVDATQTFELNGKKVVSDPVRIGVFEVGFGLQLVIEQMTPASTLLRVSGFGPESKNQVVTVRSENLGYFVVKQRMDKDGQLLFKVPHHFAEFTELTFWQGDTSTGPTRTKWFLE